MSRTSNFELQPNSKYRTPYKGVVPLLPFLQPGQRFIEPCAGDGRLVHHLESNGLVCLQSFDAYPDSMFVGLGDALNAPLDPNADLIITKSALDAT